jgi:hypothetical protein
MVYIKTDPLPSFMLGGKRVIRVDDLTAWVELRRVKSIRRLICPRARRASLRRASTRIAWPTCGNPHQRRRGTRAPWSVVKEPRRKRSSTGPSRSRRLRPCSRRRLLPARQLDHVGDQRAQLLRLLAHLLEQLAAGPLGHVAALDQQHLDVRARARDGRAQLVRVVFVFLRVPRG